MGLNKKAVLVELVGSVFYTLFFAYGVEASQAWNGDYNDANLIGKPWVALAVGAYLAAMHLAVGDISGAHFNPAVTLTLVASRNMPIIQGIVYIAVNFVGAVLGVLFKIAFRGFDSYRSGLDVQQTNNYAAMNAVDPASGGFVVDDDLSGRRLLQLQQPAHINYFWEKISPVTTGQGNNNGILDKANSDYYTGSDTTAGSDWLASSWSGDFWVEFFASVLFLFCVLNMGAGVSKRHKNYDDRVSLGYGASFSAAAIAVNYMGGAVSLNPGRALASVLFETIGGRTPHTIAGEGDSSSSWENLSYWSRPNGGKSFYVWFCAPLLAVPVAILLMRLLRGGCVAGQRATAVE